MELNPHSIHTLNKHKEGIYAVALDNLNVVYMMNEEKTATKILKVIWADTSQAACERLRTQEWLKSISQMLALDTMKFDDTLVISDNYFGGPEEKK